MFKCLQNYTLEFFILLPYLSSINLFYDGLVSSQLLTSRMVLIYSITFHTRQVSVCQQAWQFPSLVYEDVGWQRQIIHSPVTADQIPWFQQLLPILPPMSDLIFSWREQQTRIHSCATTVQKDTEFNLAPYWINGSKALVFERDPMKSLGVRLRSISDKSKGRCSGGAERY